MNIIYKTSESWTLDYEEFIAKYCYEKNIPLLGICAGYNNTIMGLGGFAIYL